MRHLGEVHALHNCCQEVSTHGGRPMCPALSPPVPGVSTAARNAAAPQHRARAACVHTLSSELSLSTCRMSMSLVIPS